MTKTFALALLCVLTGVPTFAADPGLVSRGDLLKNRQYQTFGNIALFVDSTGNDANACTSSGTDACLTIPGALAKVPKLVNNAVTVTVGAGNFAGAAITGFTMASNGSLVLQGTMATVTPASGSATGTLTSATAGSTSTTAWATATVTAAGWTVNDFTGAWLVITGGTGSGQTKLIATNTATVLTLTGGFTTTPDATSTFAIQRPSTIITTAFSFTPWSSTTAVTQGFYIDATAGNVRGEGVGTGTTAISQLSRLTIQQMKFTVAATCVRSAGGGSFTLRRNWFVVSQIHIQPGVQDAVWLYDNFSQPAAAGNFVGSLPGGTNIFAVGNVISGTSQAWNSIPADNVTSFTEYYFAQTSKSFVLSNNGKLALSGTVIDCNSLASTTGIAVGANTNVASGASLSFSTSSVSNCVTGISVGGGTAFVFNSAGTANTTAFTLTSGASVSINSGTTTTGTTDINIDGDTFTLAALRALVPPSVTNQTFNTTISQLP